MTKDKNDFAYLAGLLDSRRGQIEPDGTVSFYFHETEFSGFLVSKYGGQVGGNSSSDTEWMNETVRWSPVPGKHTEKILLAVLPYLIAKRQNAKSALNFVRSESPESNTPNYPQNG